MKSIHRGSIIPALALALIAAGAPVALASDPDNGPPPNAAPSSGPAHETDDQCRQSIRPLRSAYKDAVNKNGASSYTAESLRGPLDQAYGDCCASHASQWSWCDAGGNVRTDRLDQYPYDPGW